MTLMVKDTLGDGTADIGDSDTIRSWFPEPTPEVEQSLSDMFAAARRGEPVEDHLTFLGLAVA